MPCIFDARTWREVDSLLLRDGEKWGMSELRYAWKRSVHAHLSDGKRKLQDTAPSLNRKGRQFLADLMKTTLSKLDRNEWVMTGKQARDIGWSTGKQWFMDQKLVDAVQVCSV